MSEDRAPFEGAATPASKTEMLGRIARVIRGICGPDCDAEEAARAVIAELREPTDAMETAGMIANDAHFQDDAVRPIWRAMIDEIAAIPR